MAEVTSGRNLTVIVLNYEETVALDALVSAHVEHYDGDSKLAGLADALGGTIVFPFRGPDWDGLAELERTEIRDEHEEKWRG